MADNLLTLVQTACDELGLQRPSVVVNSTDLQIRQLYALANRDLRELQQNYDWTALQSGYDLVVNPPYVLLGTVAQGSPLVTGLSLLPGGGDDYNADENTDFGSDLPTILSNLVPQFFVAFAQGLPVNARLVAVDAQNGILTLSEPATSSVASGPITLAQDTYPEPPDFDRFITDTWWDRTNRWALLGPDSPQRDQWHRSGIVTTGPRRHFRQIGSAANNYRIWPPPGVLDSPLILAFEYISSNPVMSAAGATQSKFLADTDTCVLDDQMIILGLKWRMWQIKGFDYSDMQQEYQDYVDRKYANDGGAKTLSLSRGAGGGLLGAGIVQDGYFPGPVGPNTG